MCLNLLDIMSCPTQIQTQVGTADLPSSRTLYCCAK